MKNHELLNLIGEANEDYVLAAGDNVARPRFGWKTLAACAALVLAAHPVYRAFNPPIHDYTLVEGGGAQTTLGEEKAPLGGELSAPALDPGIPKTEDTTGNDNGQETGMDGVGYSVPGQDAAVDEEAANQYSGLLQGLGGQGGYEPETYPDWYGGAWIDHGGSPTAPAWLTVAIVGGFRTAELEARIREWCGGENEIVFMNAKYSLAHLYAIQDPAVEAVVSSGGVMSCGVGVNVMQNTLDVDVYGESISEEALVKLGRLDPLGDAIRVRVFTQSMSTLTDEIKKGPAPGQPAVEPVYDGARVEPNEEAGPVPGGVKTVEELPEPKEAAQPAVIQPAEYDVIYGVAE